MQTINPKIFESDEGLVISGTPADLMRLAESLMLVAKHPKTVHITLTDSFANKILIEPFITEINDEASEVWLRSALKAGEEFKASFSSLKHR